MQGQGAIIGVGAMEYPAEFQGASEERLAEIGVSKIITLTSTYDHRIIQGAESGEFLRRVHGLLLGGPTVAGTGFYDEIFTALRVPYEPVRWVQDIPEGAVDKTARVIELIDAYRTRGHLMADTDPLNYRQRRHPDLDVLSHGLTLWDLDRTFATGGFGGQAHMKLRDVLGLLRDSYVRTVGTEYMHIADPEQRAWLQERIEVPHQKPAVVEQKYVLAKLNAAEAFETFLQTKYVGQKRFSLEGGETVIPLLDAVLDKAAEHELDEVVIGMPHRGRLNVLANIVGKPISQIFREFEGNLDPGQAHGSGDVKYHLGAEGKYFRMFGDGETTVSLASNPSHLEAVDPVLEGIVRAKQDLLDKGEGGYTVMPLMLHGDAAFAGQGVVAETLNLALLRGYRTGGTVHVVINNQVGFTTAPEASRSSQYCTDVAKMIGAPVFHVNGDDPEACVWVAKLAVEYRQRWHNDVVIDMLCYRRRGHNEGDDPSMTQPSMYDIIDAKRSVRKIYTESLIGRGDISVEEAEHALKDFSNQLEHVFNEVRELERTPPAPSPSVEEEQSVPVDLDTSVPIEVVHRIGDAHVNLPEGFTVHPRVKPVLEKRFKMSREGDIDWAFGELLALGSLVAQGKLVRLSGQDSRRGTFVQRHSVIIDRRTGEEYVPLRHLSPEQERFLPYDSALSEFAAVGFEYGYSVANPDALVLWEAQFGDFVNGAQSVIDEFISSGEAKWGQRSDVALLLPHGLEGQGPDHSSGRIERFLQLCAEGSMTVALPSEPANYFHLLRRHALDGVRRPLVVFTPKSMLRNRAVVSPVSDFTGGRFRTVIDDPRYRENDRPGGRCPPAPPVQRQDLLGARRRPGQAAKNDEHSDDTAIVRIEQLYPLPHRQLAAVLERYPNADDRALGPGGAGEPGPLALLRAGAAGEAARAALGPHARVAAPHGGPRPGVVEGPRGRAGQHHRQGVRMTVDSAAYGPMYATDRGIEELLERRGEETVSVEWLADRLRTFVDLNPAFEDAVERVASFLARDDADDERTTRQRSAQEREPVAGAAPSTSLDGEVGLAGPARRAARGPRRDRAADAAAGSSTAPPTARRAPAPTISTARRDMAARCSARSHGVVQADEVRWTGPPARSRSRFAQGVGGGGRARR